MTDANCHRTHIVATEKKIAELLLHWGKKAFFLFTWSSFILTAELQKGTKMPKENKPRSGPPIMPNMLSTAYGNDKKSAIRNLKSKVTMFQINFLRTRISHFWSPTEKHGSLVTGKKIARA